MEININTIRLLRALVKLSSALNDSDEMKDYEQYRHQLKKDVNFFSEWLEEYIKEPVSSYANSDLDCLTDLIDLYNKYDEKVFIEDEFTTRVNLFVGKLASAFNDLSTLEEPYQSYMNALRNRLKNMLEKSYFTKYITHDYEDTPTLSDIVSSMDQIGESIIKID